MPRSCEAFAIGKAGSSGKNKTPAQRLFWYVKLREVNEGIGWEVVSVYPAIRPDGADDGGKDDEIIDPYCFRVSKYRSLMTEKDLVVAMTLEAQRSYGGTVQLFGDLVGMKNLLRFEGTLERKYNRYGSPISVDVSRGVYPLEIRKGRLCVETASTEDGGFVLALPGWMNGDLSGKSILRKVSRGVFELVDFSPAEIKLVKAIRDFGPNGRVVIPREAMKTAEPLLESLGSVLKLSERTAYEACRRHALSVLESGGGKDNRISILAELTRLRRFCCHPSLVMGTNEVPSAKMEALLGILDGLRLSGHRALVFSQFTDYLAIVRKALSARGWTHCYLDGSTPTPERARLVDAFQSGEGDFFVISLKAGGTGLNLTAADYVILLDPWWNPAVENQAADRAHRIGQKRPVTVYRLIASDTVEERVLELHREKQALAEDVLDGTSSSALSPAELMRLFG